MKKRNKILLGVLLVLLLVLLVFVVFNAVMRSVTRDQHPLVLIHSPRRYEQFALGEPILLHATARSPAGIARLELWFDGELIAEIDEGDKTPSPAVMTERIAPETPGQHELIVQAFTPLGVSGQASLLFETVTQTGEISSPITEPAVISEASLSDDISSSDNQAPDSPESTAPDVPHPSFADEPPGSPWGVYDVTFDSEDDPLDDSEEPDFLSVELLSLTTDVDYAHVHCYMGIGGIAPRRYPDTDGDQTTDEYFAKLAPNTWDIASHLSGTHAVNLPWIADLPVPIEMSCVGIETGGTNSIELGSIDPAPDPTAWDGIVRQISSEGGEGSFMLWYRVIPIGDSPRGIPLELDPSMTAPSNVRLRGSELLWDYEPREDEDPATRFRIFINNVLVWEVPGDKRSTLVPHQASNPPCGLTYSFHVEAYRRGDWSYPSNIITTQSEFGDPGCRTIVVRFDTLITHDLGGDDDRDPGDVGPVSGTFSANGFFAHFDGISEDLGLMNNTAYPINGPDGLTTTSQWISRGPAEWEIDVPPNEDLSLSYGLIEVDTWEGWHYVCVGSAHLETEEFLEPHEGVIASDMGQGNCEVTYSIDLVETAPVFLGDLPPLPQLQVDQITLSASGDKPVIHFRNDGYGDWTGQDLEIRVETTGGEYIGFYSFLGQFIPAGEIVPLIHPLLEPDRPLDICVEVDPYDQVEEAFALTGAVDTIRYCQPLPELRITDVDRVFGTGQIYVTVLNSLHAVALPDQPLGLQLQTAHGDNIPETEPIYLDDVQIEPGLSTVLELDVSDIVDPDVLDDGYTVIVNPDGSIAESNEDNNTYEVPANGELEIIMGGLDLRWYPLSQADPCVPDNPNDAENQTQTVWLDLQALSPFGNRSLGNISREIENVDNPNVSHYTFIGPSIRVELDGTETLMGTVSGEARRLASTEELGENYFRYEVYEQWGATEFVENLDNCSLTGLGTISVVDVVPPDAYRRACGYWSFFFHICMRQTEE